MKSGYLLRDIINKVAGIHFTSSEQLHTLGALLEAAPKASAMQVIAGRFKPMRDQDGGVVYQPAAEQTIDFDGLRSRFKDFGLNWPAVRINNPATTE